MRWQDRGAIPPRKSARPGQALPLAAGLLVILLLVIGLAVDAGHLLLARRALHAAVDAAAHAGAQRIDVVSLRLTGQVELDTIAARQAAWAMLAAEGVDDAIVMTWPDQVTVVARASVPLTLLRLAPGLGDGVVVEAEASAAPRVGLSP